MSVRDYICRLQRTMKNLLLEKHGIKSSPSDNTGVFADDGKTKLASIGVQVRHRFTTHGFAFNVTKEPLAWFDQVTACGLADVKAGAIETHSTTTPPKDIYVVGQISSLVELFGREMERDVVRLEDTKGDEVSEAIWKLEEEAAELQRSNPVYLSPK